jgi:pyridoxal/pyridoxine/pyridoxamine kinase
MVIEAEVLADVIKTLEEWRLVTGDKLTEYDDYTMGYLEAIEDVQCHIDFVMKMLKEKQNGA